MNKQWIKEDCYDKTKSSVRGASYFHLCQTNTTGGSLPLNVKYLIPCRTRASIVLVPDIKTEESVRYQPLHKVRSSIFLVEESGGILQPFLQLWTFLDLWNVVPSHSSLPVSHTVEEDPAIWAVRCRGHGAWACYLFWYWELPSINFIKLHVTKSRAQAQFLISDYLETIIHNLKGNEKSKVLNLWFFWFLECLKTYRRTQLKHEST